MTAINRINTHFNSYKIPFKRSSSEEVENPPIIQSLKNKNNTDKIFLKDFF